MQRLTSPVQFQAVMAQGRTTSRTEHFALHTASLETPKPTAAPKAPTSGPSPEQPATAGRSSVQPAGPRTEGSATVGRLEVQPTGPRSEGPAALFAVRTEPWLGVIVPKRWAKRAVTRNAIKRQIYTVSQDFEAQLPVAAHVVRLRAGFDRKVFLSATSDVLKKAVRAELQQLFAGVRR
jgi:ribonuclease P protein component